MATWNMRTLLGDADGGAGPRCKTALLAQELKRYTIDFAALSETRLSGEGSIVEGDTTDGYTIFWRGYPDGEPRQHGVGLAVRNIHMNALQEEPKFISERMMTLRVPLARNDHMLIISAYAPTLVAEEIKDAFYEDLHNILRTADARDKIVLLEDFNARVGRRSDLWGGVIGPHAGLLGLNQLV